MKVLILLAAIVAVCVAVSIDDLCDGCDYNSYGEGFVSGYYCNQFYMCQILPNGEFKAILMCCPDDLVWGGDSMACVPDYYGTCPGGYNYTDCPVISTPSGGQCYLIPHTGDREMFYIWAEDALHLHHCAPRTHYDPENCTCVHGGDLACDDDPMLYFPFATHDNDIQCMHAEGVSHGDAYVNQDIGALCLDGDGDYLEVPFLANWFNGYRGSFTVSLWFAQEQYSYAINAFEGLFANGDCHNDSTIFIAVEEHVVCGMMTTNTDTQVFFPDDPDAPQRAYTPIFWHHVALRFDQSLGKLSFFFNGTFVDDRALTGYVENTHDPATIGLIYFDYAARFFFGCIDDVMVFNRFVSNDEILNGLFARERTNGITETPYTYPIV